MKKLVLLAGLGLFIGCNSDDDTSEDPNAPTEYTGYTLVWNDEFDGENIDMTKWGYETGDGTAYGLPIGWGNSEKQIYTDGSENSGIKIDDEGNSVLAITALRTGPNSYTSAKMTTNGKMSVRYGRIEARVKLPAGKGFWPAFWTLGDNRSEIDWPGCGEIDIFELLGDTPNKVYHNVHFTNSDNEHEEVIGEKILTTGNFSDDYHIFTLDWTPESLVYSVDGQMSHQVLIRDDMKEYLRSHYLILNLAVGGFWPGDPDETTPFPSEMLVDYVRVYSDDALNPDPAPELDLAEESLGQFVEANIASYAIKDGFDAFGEVNLSVWGGGGEPVVSTSSTTVDGDSSVVLAYQGGAWGGAYIEILQPKDLSSYTGNLHFSIHSSLPIADAEIKLESALQATFAAVYLKDYTPADLGDGWIEYTIPIADLSGLDFTELRIPFAMWNPVDATGEFLATEVIVDNIYFD